VDGRDCRINGCYRDVERAREKRRRPLEYELAGLGRLSAETRKRTPTHARTKLMLRHGSNGVALFRGFPAQADSDG
jgi:hypothetical protein